MLNCQHHVSWVRAVDGGLHQCILCMQVVAAKDVYPKLEDLPAEFRRRWEAHEATRPAAAAVEAKPSAAKPTAASTPTATPPPSPRPSPPVRGGERDDEAAAPSPRVSPPAIPPLDPHAGA